MEVIMNLLPDLVCVTPSTQNSIASYGPSGDGYPVTNCNPDDGGCNPDPCRPIHNPCQPNR
jgi:hypothetical protein